ncbi:uncharacterized protein GGS22DRAFT_40879 [Annulohypoxylon maeteangense]|uniref:uncharacterized protein n=1 Tax=Annulohypoxylon maeteangense TaxID=1927788 RepID=UPI002008E8C0|nr:uncharacterized protein GGS22DRAFT_40879 [Annulohypoxylon maeteangense]KAI0882791.1 hypothetical protein GGS22DRAFT_40879 [Annulohypoxylon maeteangense]
MLEYFTIKKLKKHREDKAEKQRLEKEERTKEKGKGKEVEITTKSSPAISTSASSSSPEFVLETVEGMPILDKEDEKFLERLTSPSDTNDDDDETPPPLPPRVKTPVIEIDSDSSSLVSKDESNGNKKDASAKDSNGKAKEQDKDDEKPDHKPKRFAFVTNLSRNISLKRKPDDKHEHKGKHKKDQHLTVPPSTTTATTDPEQEAQKEEEDMAHVLEDLNLAASTDNKAFSLSKESAETLRKFTQVLKDLVNGVPTAYQDLVGLIEDRDGVLARSYEKLPKSLKKLVAQLPDKLTSSLAPELLAVAAEAQGLKVEEEAGKEGAKKLLSPGNLMELVTKPGAVVGLLKGIVNALKTRFPAFIGTNVLWSMAVFLLLSVLWYCYKRGREVRLEKEASEAADKAVGEPGVVVGEVEEVDDMEGGNGDSGKSRSVPLIEAVPSGSQSQTQQPAISVSGPVEEGGGKK